MHTETDVVKVVGGKSIEAAELEGGTRISCRILVASKGVKPRSELAAGTGIEAGKGIVVNEEMRTSVPDVYAAGDVAETVDVVTGEHTVNAIWPAAAEQGRIAGANMAGQHERYDGSIRMNSAEFFGLPMISIGVVRPKQAGYEILKRSSADGMVTRKLVLKDNVIVGVVLVGEIANAGVFKSLMVKKVNVSSVKNRLLDRHFGSGPCSNWYARQG